MIQFLVEYKGNARRANRCWLQCSPSISVKYTIYAAGPRDYFYEKAGSHLVFSLLKIHEYIVASWFQLFKAVNKNTQASRAKFK